MNGALKQHASFVTLYNKNLTDIFNEWTNQKDPQNLKFPNPEVPAVIYGFILLI